MTSRNSFDRMVSPNGVTAFRDSGLGRPVVLPCGFAPKACTVL
jgi:hypothetical protein